MPKTKATPKWRTRWNELVGDHKYLAIRNWAKFQESAQIRGWIKDHLAKDDDPDYYTNPVIYRWMMDWCRRQCGRLRHNLYSDPEGLLARMNMSDASDYSVAPRYLVRLVEVGFLIPTNEQDPFAELPNIRKGNEKVRGSKAGDTPAPPLSPAELDSKPKTQRRPFDAEEAQ